MTENSDKFQPRRLSVPDLLEYWRTVEAITGDQSIVVLSTREMPPWNAICSELNWATHHASRGYFTAKRHGFYGVYRLVALASDNDLSNPVCLNRLCGQDSTGTLYIGESKNLGSRLNQLKRSAQSRERSHGAIESLRRIALLDIPAKRLGISLLFTGRHTRGVERDLINAYINSFGDAPPLNYKI